MKVYVKNIGTLVKVSDDLLRCNPEDFSAEDIKKMLPPPHLLPCFFDKNGLEVAIFRYKGIVELLEAGLKML